jgi:polyisoprenyl-teichoic acid--peptidoglycan teichoic acid transferase
MSSTQAPGPGRRPPTPPTRRPLAPRRRPHPLVAAALSALVPGLGQWYAGYRRRAWVYLAITGVVVVPAAVLLILVFYITGIGLAIDLARPFFRTPGLLLVLLASNALLLVFRAVSVVDAFLLARISAGVRAASTMPLAAMVAVMALVLFVTAVPHGWAGQRNLALYDLLTHDFVADPGQQTTSTTSPTPGTTVPGTPTTMPTTTTTRPDPFAGLDRINVLLLGSDAGPDRDGLRTDTIIIVSVDPQTGWTAMFSIPRNFTHFPVPPDHALAAVWPEGRWGDDRGFDVAWRVYPYGLENPGLFEGPNTGGDAAKTIYGHLLGLDINYFAMVDLHGFVDIVDALGGVDITVTRRIYDAEYPHEDGVDEDGNPITIEIEWLPGTHHMNGHEALAFARTRRQSDDWDRMGRQRCVLEALARQADPIRLLRELPTLVPAVQRSVITDVPVRSFPDFIELLARVDTEEIVSVRFIPNAPEFAGTPTSYISHRVTGWNVPNVDLIRETVAVATSLPPPEAIERLNLQPLDEVCGRPEDVRD